MSIFTDKTLMITGGTGSFGNAVLNRFLRTDIGEIRIFSRDEKKQDDMRHEYQSKYPDVANKIKFFIGDVRDIQSCRNAMPGVDYIFHAAALKQVPSCEFFPMEAVKTNVIGTDNILTAAIEAGVGAVICLSTDKAAYPINAMGISKAIEEKVAVAKSRYSGKTKICCTRYGNVMCSRGSVIPLWIDQIRNGNPITLTEPKMTRFIMSLEEAVDLVLFAFEHGQNGDILVQKAPACTIQIQAEAVCELFGGKKEDIKVIGIRHGEKMYETLLTKEECAKAEDMGNFYRVPADNRGLNYDKYFKTMLDEKDMQYEMITEFSYVLAMSRDNPLASAEKITFDALKDYIEIAHADPYVPSLPLSQVRKEELPDNIGRRIFVFERASQFELLSENPETFMWVSPIPQKLLDRYDLVQIPCEENKKIYKDILIYKRDYKLTVLDKAFIDELCKSKREMF